MKQPVTLGRNSPCPCGSGKKFKRCCGAGETSPSGVPDKADIFALVRRTAYAGSVGSARDRFCRRVLNEKRKVFESIAISQKLDASRTGHTVRCTEGCSHCCLHFVGGSLQECEVIVHYLYSHKQRLERFLGSYPAWRKKIGAHEGLFHAVGRSYKSLSDSGAEPEVVERHRELSERYFRLSIPCPFLNDGSCDIYPGRPYGCASLFSVSGPDLCAPENPSPPDQRSVVCGYTEMPYFYRENPILTVSNVPLMVYEILKGGVWYLSGLPGLKGMDWEMFEDPRAARLLRSVRVP